MHHYSLILGIIFPLIFKSHKTSEMKVLLTVSSDFTESILRAEWRDDFYRVVHIGEDELPPEEFDLVILEPDKPEKVRSFLHSLSRLPKVPAAVTLLSNEEVYSPDAGDDVDETTPLHPATERGRNAVAIEKETLLWAEAANTILTVLRCAIPFGPDMKGWAVDFFNQVTSGRFLHVRGISGRLSTVMGIDIAHATRLTAALPGIFNVADGTGPTWLELAEAMSANAGAQKRMITLPAKWADLAWKLFPRIPAVRDSLSPEIREKRSLSRNLSSRKISEATGMTFFNTLHVLARTDKKYPYQD